MTTIQVIPSVFICDYQSICDYFNANKPSDWMPISKLQKI
jgi:hypothetical protein